MIILGIDPGVARVGYGALEFKGERILASAHGCIQTKKGEAQCNRLLSIRDDVRGLIKKYKPAAVAVEKLFFAKNAKTASAVGEARGVILLAAAEAGLPVLEITPLQVKQAVTGYGAAGKQQVQEMVRRYLQLKTTPRPDDAADALAIAISGMRYLRLRSWIT
ncbi:crossover junction endodeoxyribonuclease RuvC [Patescibacteria group bacterium]|nr:MAG: crossover junction endodeoxyribonuclease RuvC [Patescibacteria group bacterium]